MKRAFKILGGVAACAALLLAALLLFAWSWLTPERLGPLIAGFANDRIAAELSFGSAEVAFPGTIVIADVALRERTDPVNLIAAERIRLDLDLRALLSRRIVVSGVTVEQPRLALVLGKQGTIRLFDELAGGAAAKATAATSGPDAPPDASDPPRGSAFTLSVDAVRVLGGALELRDEGSTLPREIKMKGIALGLFPDLPGRSVRFDLAVDEPGLCGALAFSGEAAYGAPALRGALTVARVDPADFVPELKKNRADVALQNVVARIAAVPDANGSREVEVKIERAEWEGQTVEGTFRMPASGRVEATLRAERLDLARVEKAFRTLLRKATGMNDLPAVSGRVALDLGVSLSPAFTDPRASGTIELIKVRVKPKDLPEVALDGLAKLAGTRIALERLALSAPGIAAEAGGTVDPMAGKLDLSVRKATVDFAKLSLPDALRQSMPLPSAGTLDALLTATGTFAKPDLKGRLTATAVELPPALPGGGILDAQAVYAGGTLTLERAGLVAPLYRAGLAGKIEDPLGACTLSLKAQLAGVEVGKLFAAAGVAGMRGAGELSLTAEVAGTAARPTVSFRGGGRGLRYEYFSVETGKTALALPFDDLALTGALKGEALTAKLEPSLFSGRLSADLAMTLADGFPFRLAVATPRPPDLAAFLEVNPYARKALSGKLFADLAVDGKAVDQGSFKGKGRVRFESLLLDGHKLFGKLAPYIPNLAQERFEKASVDLVVAGTRLDLQNLALANEDLAWEGGATVDLASFAVNGATRLTIFKPAVKGSGIEANFPEEGVGIKVPLGGTLFAPDISAALDLSALLKTQAGQKAVEAVKDKAEKKLLDALLGKDRAREPAPAAPNDPAGVSPAPTPDGGASPAVAPAPAPAERPKEKLEKQILNTILGGRKRRSEPVPPSPAPAPDAAPQEGGTP